MLSDESLRFFSSPFVDGILLTIGKSNHVRRGLKIFGLEYKYRVQCFNMGSPATLI